MAATSDTWVFGYGSLVSPTSMARTIGRLAPPESIAVAQLAGYGRRWNYGAISVRGEWHHDAVAVTDGVMVALGVERSDGERCNGVVVCVTDDELAHLDLRERSYDRTDVTDRITFEPAVDGIATARPAGARIVTYVPRAEAIAHYETARDQQRAAIRQDYWDLVDEAFARLGPEHLAQYRSTPPPDVPVVDMVWATR